MGLIKCPNCGLVVSDYSGECFGCGCRLPKQTQTTDEELDISFERTESSHDSRDIDSKMVSWGKTNKNSAPIVTTSTNFTSYDKVDDKDNTKGNHDKQSSSTFIRILLIVLLLVIILLAGVLGWYYGIKIPKDNAYSAYLDTVKDTNLVVSQYNDGVVAFNDRAKEVISI